MRQTLLVAPVLAALLVAAQTVPAAAQEVRFYERSTLDEVRTTLQGPLRAEPVPMSRPLPPRPGFLNEGRPFSARLTDVLLSSYDAPWLVAIVEDAASLPPDSRVEIQGRMDGDPFLVTIESDRCGRKTARLEGLVFRDRHEAMNLLSALQRRGVQHARLDGRVGFQRIAGRIDQGMTQFEG